MLTRNVIIKIGVVLLLFGLSYGFLLHTRNEKVKHIIIAAGGLPDAYTFKIGNPTVIICQTSPKKMFEWGMQTPLLDKYRGYNPKELSEKDKNELIEKFIQQLDTGQNVVIYSDPLGSIDKGENSLIVTTYKDDGKYFLELSYSVHKYELDTPGSEDDTQKQ